MKYRRTAAAVLICLLLTCLLSDPMTAFAEVKRAAIVTLDEQQDLAIMFSFDQEIVELAFWSPSGVRKTAADSDVEYEEGDLWSTYRIVDAEAGTWSVEYDLGANSAIDYSIIEDDYGLWIQYFEVVEMNGETARLRFEADCDFDTVWYHYEISAAGATEELGVTDLASGYADSDREMEVEVRLTSLSSGRYELKLKVYCQDGEVELFDSASTDPLDYVNPYAPGSMEDYRIRVDEGNLTCELDWSPYSSWRDDAYRLLVRADGEELYGEVLDPNVTSSGVVFPEGTKKLEFELSSKQGGVWSEPLAKTLDLDREYIRIVSSEVTNAGQVTMEYKTAAERTLNVVINNEGGTYLLKDDGQLTFDLEPGPNHVSAVFEGDSLVSFQVDKDVYYDAYPPEISLYEALDGKTFYSDAVNLIGRISGGDRLTVNDVEAELGENGNFTVRVDLAVGENVVELTAFDVNGNSAAMKLTLYRATKLFGGGDGGSGGWIQFLPIMAALLASLFIIIFSLIFMKKRDPAQKKNRVWTWVLCDVVLGVLEGVCVVLFIVRYRFVNSLDYLKLVERSVTEAAAYLRVERLLAVASIAGGVLLAASIVVTIVKSRKKKVRVEEPV